MWPQYTMIAIAAMGIILGLYLHGRPYSSPTFDFRYIFIRVVVIQTLLLFGGFYKDLF